MANVNIVELTIEKIDEVKSKLGRTLGASMRLRDLIRQVRAARTAAEERAVVEKESANIRDSFRDEQDKYKCRNMAKLLYIHMLGYPAHFGQMETVKLVGTKDKRFTDIRIGYLGAMLLLDERSEVHLLVTNCLKSHLNESDQFVTGLALCTLGSICSAEMCRDLAGEVEKLLIKSTNTYIKKKAALCAHRIVRKAPELIEMFISSTRSLLNEKHHGVLMGGITLVSEMCELSADVRTHFKRMVPNLVRILKNLLMTGYSPEHDVSGISDPFLQVKILKLLRILGRDDPRTSEEMNDILAQVATNTETSKNVGNAILYETVLTIMEISSESGLRVLGINILGRFLLNPDKNIRYVALNTLLKTVNVDFQAVQRHRTTVVECLKDQDVSIRKRAMELSFALINKTNITNMSKEILIFLETADPEFKAECASKMYVATERYSPSFVWHLDTMVSVLKLAGNHVPDEVVAAMIQLISVHPELQACAPAQLFRTVNMDLGGLQALNAQPLLQIAFWCVGEFGDLLVNPPEQELGSPSHRYPVNGKQVEESEVVEMFEKLMPCNAMTIPTREYGLTSLAKLVTRFETCAERIRALIRTYTAHMNLELQQRSVEYAQLLRKDELKYGLLERMPTISHNALRDSSSAAVRIDGGNEGVDESTGSGALPSSSDNLLFSTDDDAIATGSTLPPASAPSTRGLNDVGGDLFDFIGLNNGGATTTPKGASNEDRQSTLLDLDDLMGGGIATAKANNNQQTADMNFGGLFHVGELASKATTTTGSGQASIIAVNKSGIEVQIRVESTFSDSESSPQEAIITLVTTNNNPVPINSYAFQAAVTKAYQIELFPASGLTLEANSQSIITQNAKIRRISHGQALRLRIKINYAMDGRRLTIQQDVEKLPGL